MKWQRAHKKGGKEVAKSKEVFSELGEEIAYAISVLQ